MSRKSWEIRERIGFIWNNQPRKSKILATAFKAVFSLAPSGFQYPEGFVGFFCDARSVGDEISFFGFGKNSGSVTKLTSVVRD